MMEKNGSRQEAGAMLFVYKGRGSVDLQHLTLTCISSKPPA